MLTQEKTQATITDNGRFDLVKGEFTLEEAAEIINDLFMKKINFNEVKAFSQFVRKGAKDPQTLERIEELKRARQQAQQLIATAEREGRSIRLESTISIELI